MLLSRHVSARILARLARRTAYSARARLASNEFFVSSSALQDANSTHRAEDDVRSSDNASSDTLPSEDSPAREPAAVPRASAASSINIEPEKEGSGDQATGDTHGVSGDGPPVVSDAVTTATLNLSDGEPSTSAADLASAMRDAMDRNIAMSDSLLHSVQYAHNAEHEQASPGGSGTREDPHDESVESHGFRSWLSQARSAMLPSEAQLEDISQPVGAHAEPPYGTTQTRQFGLKNAERRGLGDSKTLDRVLLAHTTPETRSSSEQQGLPSSMRLPWYKRRVDGLLGADDGLVVTNVTPQAEQRPIAKLAHGLTRVLHNPGVHWVKDPRSSRYNFPGWVGQIPAVDTFAFDRVTGFVPSSRDEDLLALAKQEGCVFAGSTSSLTGMLSQIYFLLSGEMLVDTSVLSCAFIKQPKTYTPGQRMPVSVTLKYHNGVYSADSEAPHLGKRETILSFLGTMLEKYFTLSLDEFDRLLTTSKNPDLSRGITKEPYNYAKFGKFMMRAQLDCHSSELPGSGVFDLKTRAALPIRLDVFNYEDHTSYEIRHLTGLEHSFEKEYYDLIRSAFLKYSFQARIGNMDGVMVAYHNTAKIFGYQYIPLEEMYARLFGHAAAGPRVFEKCVGLLEAIFTEIVTYFPEQTVHCTWETKEFGRVMHVWIEPETWPASEVKPLVQLDIKITNFLNMTPSSARKAVMSWDEPWSVRYSIAKSSLSQDRIRGERQKAHERQLHIVQFGLNINDIVEHGDNVDRSLLKKAEGRRSKVEAQPMKTKKQNAAVARVQ